jgi:serine/threonine-protein kinase
MATSIMPDGAGAAPPKPLEAGDRIGNYRIERQLGEGGMGTVYRAVHQLIGSRAVIKVLHPRFAANREIAARFVNEARAVTSLKHRNIVTVFDCGVSDDGRLYIAMEYLDGSTLAAFLASLGGPLDLPTAITIVAQVGSGLQCAHDHGIVHRDIKPENVFLTYTLTNPKHATILDFGISKIDDDTDQVRTGTNVVIGTPPYMAPEQLRASKDVDGKADVYALAVLAWEMVTGQRLWAHVANASAIIEQQILDVGRTNPCRTMAGIPADVGTVIARGLAYQTADRWESPRAFVVALAHACPATDWSENGIEIVRRVAPELMIVHVDDETAGRPSETARPPGVDAAAPVWIHAHRTPLPQPVARGEVPTAAHGVASAPAVAPAQLLAGPGTPTTLGAAAGHVLAPRDSYAPTRPGYRRARVAAVALACAGAVAVLVAVAASSGGGERPPAAAAGASLPAIDAGLDAPAAADAAQNAVDAAIDAAPASVPSVDAGSRRPRPRHSPDW